ncbi:MAG: PDZ domain-containing protein [Candidatus Cloacimonetes bacterium]|nr:PDZ domain-containing protein [Candidatus Cloacimonadota bacterium]
MKQMVICFLVIILAGYSLLAQSRVKIDLEELDIALEELDLELGDSEKQLDKVIITSSGIDRPKMGVFLSDLDFKDIYEMHYDYNYGVLISGVSEGGPAQKAGLLEGDIIMEFDGMKVRFESHLVKLIQSHNIGDKVKVKFFRDEQIMETELLLDTLSRKETGWETVSGQAKKRLDVGHGGGSWYPTWYMPDVSALNDILNELGFKEETFSEDGFLIQGGGGQGNVGKGWFIGGMGAGYSNSETTRHDWIHYVEDQEVTSTVARTAKYYVNYGGATLDKRFAFSRNLISSLGFMIGVGQHAIKIKQVDNNGDLPNFDFEENLSDQMDDYYDYVSQLDMKQDFIVFQPKFSLMYRLLDWLALRTEVGYMVSYSSAGWKAKRNGEDVKLNNPPDVNMDGLTLTIGPWFGF